MATTRRRQSLAIIDQLSSEAWRFSFVQAVRIIDAAVNTKHPRSVDFADEPIGGLTPPHKEFVRFRNQVSLAFSASDVASVSAKELSVGEVTRQWQMSLQFMGLAGSHGVMPHYFTEILLQRLRDNDAALAAFVNIFEHRSISLFYQASGKYRLPRQYERNRVHKEKKADIYTHILASLAGLGTLLPGDKLPVPKEALLGYSGLFARPIRSASALKGLLRDYFDLDSEIEQFCGQWQDLPDDLVSRLAGGDAGMGCNNQLGFNTVIGKSCWQIQSKFRIQLAPMSYKSFMELAPGGKKLKALQGVIAFFSGSELDYDISIKLQREYAQPTRLTLDVDAEPLLGWNTPLGNMSGGGREIEPIDILVSKHTLPADAGLPTAA
ncbi:MAG: type VI secretion system protein ImpH [Oceanicoccus sp.]|jgi:type VI secretion system protein ImpH